MPGRRAHESGGISLMVRRIILAVIVAVIVAASAALTAVSPAPGASAATAAAATAGAAGGWHHSALIYHSAGRTQRQWEQHLMQVNSSGQFTGRWLFDAAI